MTHIIKLFLIALTALSVAACRNDATEQSGTMTSGNVEVEVTLLNITTQTRAAIDQERAISTVDVLVFDASGTSQETEATFLYTRYAWQKSGATYRATLLTGNNLNIYFAINASELIEQTTLTEGMTFQQVRNLLTLQNPADIKVENGLPMWGHAPLNMTIEESTSTKELGTISLLRSVASVDVNIAADNFGLTSGWMVYAADKGYLPYSVENLTADGQIALPEMPDDAQTTTQWEYTVNPGETSINNVFYLFENDADGTTKQYTKLIIQGVWSGSGKTTYYPLALRDANNNEKVQVARNRKFIINVASVHGDGFDTLEEAKAAEDTNIAYQVIEWDEWNDTSIIIDGSNFVSILSKKALLADKVASTAILDFSTNAINWSGSQESVSTNVVMSYNSDFSDSVTSHTIDTHPRFTVEIIPYDDDQTGEEFYMLITAKQVYGTDNNPAVLYIRLGRIQFSVEFEQLENAWIEDNNDDVLLS